MLSWLFDQSNRGAKAIAASQLFDRDWYLECNPDVRAAGIDPLLHYLKSGAAEGRDPNPLFDSDWYVERNPDVRAAGMNPLVHYLKRGAAAGRNPNPLFDAALYLEQLTPDERNRWSNPLVHYYARGRARGLRVNKLFDPKFDTSSRDRIVQSCANGRPTVLMVLHYSGGGAEKHVWDIVGLARERINSLLIMPTLEGPVAIMLAEPELPVKLHFDARTQWNELLALLRECNIARLHIHHLQGSEHYLRALVRELGLPFDFTAHDYYALSPQPHLIGRDGRFVGENLAAKAEELLEMSAAPTRPRSLTDWQAEHRWLLTEASRVIVPSHDVARRLHLHVPDLRPVVAAHPEVQNNIQSRRPVFSAGSPLRIALLGELALHKGLDVLSACARLAKAHRRLLEFQIIGAVDAHRARELLDLGVRITGRYDHADLPRLIHECAPHLLWYPAQAPESFSYTLSEGLLSNLPMVVPDLGALAERVGGRPWTWVMPWDLDSAAWNRFFLTIREQNFVTGTPPAPVGLPWNVTDEFYHGEYLSWTDSVAMTEQGIAEK
jgi:glycosyltransferase involved in cell wall biosynthesis